MRQGRDCLDSKTQPGARVPFRCWCLSVLCLAGLCALPPALAGTKSVRHITKHRSPAVKLKALSPEPDTLVQAKPSNNATKAKIQEMLVSGARLHREGNLLEAENTFRNVIGLDPKNVDAFYNLGALAEGRGDLVTALGHYRAAQALKPDDRQISEAVKSTEKAITTKQTILPLAPPYQAAPAPPLVGTPPFLGTPVLGAPVGTFSGVPEYNAPVLALPSSVEPPITSDGQIFQLSSNRNAATPPVVGVQPMAQPPQTLPVMPPVQPVAAPVRPPSVGRAIARQTLNMAASYALRGTGLHCPICHFLRF